MHERNQKRVVAIRHSSSTAVKASKRKAFLEKVKLANQGRQEIYEGQIVSEELRVRDMERMRRRHDEIRKQRRVVKEKARERQKAVRQSIQEDFIRKIVEEETRLSSLKHEIEEVLLYQEYLRKEILEIEVRMIHLRQVALLMNGNRRRLWAVSY